jgi:hypothetical protein
MAAMDRRRLRGDRRPLEGIDVSFEGIDVRRVLAWDPFEAIDVLLETRSASSGCAIARRPPVPVPFPVPVLVRGVALRGRLDPLGDREARLGLRQVAW